MASERYQTGIKIRKEVLGKNYVEKALGSADEFNHDFQQLLTEYCWGATWSRSGLSRQQRSLNVLCMLAAQNNHHEFRLHFRGALRNGCSLEELRETLLQIGVYCGIPVANEAFRLAREVLREEGVEIPAKPMIEPKPEAPE